MENVGIVQALGLSLLGMGVVFLMLVLLMFVIVLLTRALKARAVPLAAAAQPAPAPAIPAAPAPAAPAKSPAAEGGRTARGSCGPMELFCVDDRTAALLMAIVAEQMGAPLCELRFKSIRKVK